MWHGKSAVSKGMGYSHGRRMQRMTQDSSIRMSNKAESGFGAAGILGLLIIVGAIIWMVSNA